MLPLVADTPAPLVAVFVLPLFGLLLYAVGFGLPGPAARLPGRLGAVGAVAAPAVVWTALELVEIRAAPGGWWATAATSQEGRFTAGLAAWGGHYALTLAIVAVNYAIALALVRRTRGAAAGAVLLAAAVAAAALAAPVGPPGEARPLTVAGTSSAVS